MINKHFTGSKQTSDVPGVNSYSRAELVRAPDTSLWLLCPLCCDVSSRPRDRWTVKTGERDGRRVRVTVSRRRGRAQLTEKFGQLVPRLPEATLTCAAAGRRLPAPAGTCNCLSAPLHQTPPSVLRPRAAKQQFWAFVMMRIIRLSPTSNVDFMEGATCASRHR